MEKRFVLAIFLCLVVLILYSSYMSKQQEQWRASHPAEPPESGQEVPPGEGVPAGGQPEAPVPGPATKPDLPAAALDVQCREVVVDTPLYRAVFCSWNGRLMSWKLKNYKTLPPCKCPVLSWFGRPEAQQPERLGEEAWVELVHGTGPEEFPLGLEVSTEKTRAGLQETLEPDLPRLDLQSGGPEGRIVFSGRDKAGRAIERIYTFSPDRYLVGMEIRLQGVDAEFQSAGLGLKLTNRVPANAKADRYSFLGFMGLVDGKLIKLTKVKDDQDRYVTGEVAWEGFSDKYFLQCLIPQNNPRSSVALEMPESDDSGPGSLWLSRLVYSIKDHTDTGQASFSYSLYMGPKDLDVLKASGHSLDASVDLGKFSFIAVPLLMLLKFFFRYTHNYGIAIILLTVLVKILLHPLTRKQFHSMKKMQHEMQKMKPKMEAIREKYKNDKERMNKELMDLYRTHQINPLSGCWPVLVQIPVFFALYNALLNSIELRHSPFIFWIRDLSEKDPCYVTPILMGLSQFLQQKMTPTTGDPAQQKIMTMMPLVFTFMFLYFPSGLVLYWLVNNVISIAQQYFSLRKKED